VVYVVADIVVLPAYDRISAARELAADKETQLRRYRRAELRKGQYTDLLKLADDRLSKSESVVIPAANASLASAELQSLIEGSGNRVGLMVGQRMIGVPRRLNTSYAELPMTLSFDPHRDSWCRFSTRYVRCRVSSPSERCRLPRLHW